MTKVKDIYSAFSEVLGAVALCTVMGLFLLSASGCEKMPEDMVFVEEGEFIMGTNESDTDEGPERQVALRSFYIDKFEVTNAEYKVFVNETKHNKPREWIIYGFRESHANRPVVFVSFDDGEAYCKWAAKRLPTEEEWEKAARGTDGRTYPWSTGGNDFDETRANTSLSGIVGTTAVGSYLEGASPYGSFDMAGNVWEWTSSEYGDKAKVVRGGSWGLTHRFARTFTRVGYMQSTKINNLGIRCVKDG